MIATKEDVKKIIHYYDNDGNRKGIDSSIDKDDDMGILYNLTIKEVHAYNCIGTDIFGMIKEECKEIRAKDSIALKAGQFAVIITNETLNMPKNTFGIVFPKNTFSSVGLQFINSGFIVPGQNTLNSFTVVNISQKTMFLDFEDKIARVAFFKTNGDSSDSDISSQDINNDVKIKKIRRDIKESLPTDFAAIQNKSFRKLINHTITTGITVTFIILFLSIVIPLMSTYIKDVLNIYDTSLKIEINEQKKRIKKLETRIDQLSKK